MGTGAPITGSAGTSIAAQFSRMATGTPVLANDVNQMGTSFANDLATISTGNVTIAGTKTFSSAPDFDAGATIAQTFALTAEGTGCNLAGTWVTPNTATLACASGGAWVVASGGFLDCIAGSKVALLGRVVPHGVRVPVPDSSAAKTLGVATGSGVDYAGKRFVLANPNVGANGGSVPRVRTLKSTTVVPDEGETIEVIWNPGASIGAGAQIDIKTEGGTVIASFVGSAAAEVTILFCWAEFEFVSGAWRLGANTGMSVDSGNALFGVVPGAGA